MSEKDEGKLGLLIAWVIVAPFWLLARGFGMLKARLKGERE